MHVFPPNLPFLLILAYSDSTRRHIWKSANLVQIQCKSGAKCNAPSVQSARMSHKLLHFIPVDCTKSSSQQCNCALNAAQSNTVHCRLCNRVQNMRWEILWTGLVWLPWHVLSSHALSHRFSKIISRFPIKYANYADLIKDFLLLNAISELSHLKLNNVYLVKAIEWNGLFFRSDNLVECNLFDS